MKSGIYLFKNKVNGKVYVGQSIDVEERIKSHFALANSKKKSGELMLIDRAIRKHGSDAFDVKILVECSEDELDKYETYYISFYDSTNTDKGYNLQSGGGHYTLSEEGRKNVSVGTKKGMEKVDKKVLQTQLNKPRTPETRKKISDTLTGVPKPEGFGAAASARQKNVPKSEEMKQKYRAAAARNDYKWVTNGEEELRIKGIELDYYLSINYRRGRMPFSDTHLKNLQKSHKKTE